MYCITLKFHHVALSAQSQRERLYAQAADNPQIASCLAQLLVMCPLVEQLPFHGSKILRPLLFDVEQHPLPAAKPEMLQAGDHQKVVGRVHYDLLSQCTPSGSSASTQTV